MVDTVREVAWLTQSGRRWHGCQRPSVCSPTRVQGNRDGWASGWTAGWRVVRPPELLNHLLYHQLREGLQVRGESRGPCSEVWSWCPITRPSLSSHVGRAEAPAGRCGAGAL